MKHRWGWVVVALFLSASLPHFLTASAAQIYPKSAKKPAPLTAEKLITRLDKFEDENQQLVQAMSDIKSELAIIKVRAAVPKRVINQLSSGTDCP